MRSPSEAAAYRVLVIDDDRAWAQLIEEWLGAIGIGVVQTGLAEPAVDMTVDLAIVDVPQARQAGEAWIRRIAELYPGTPIVAVSSDFFSGIRSCGPLARELGADCVLAKPASRDALTSAIRRLLIA
jgi:DNA-binding response OmpR family regulator